MTSAGWLGLCCALVSAIAIALLAKIDPKRRGRPRQQTGLRRALSLAIFVPGLMLGLIGRWSDFFVWIGAAALLGWAIAAAANTVHRRSDRCL